VQIKTYPRYRNNNKTHILLKATLKYVIIIIQTNEQLKLKGEIIMFNIENGTIVLAISIVGAVFVVKEFILKKKRFKKKMNTQIEEEMKQSVVSYEKAKDNVLIKKLADAMKVDEDSYAMDGGKIVKQGNGVSFTTAKYGFITGEFIGVKKCQAKGFTVSLIVKLKDGQILQAPVEHIDTNTIMSYER
jgi:hypothetical protein